MANTRLAYGPSRLDIDTSSEPLKFTGLTLNESLRDDESEDYESDYESDIDDETNLEADACKNHHCFLENGLLMWKPLSTRRNRILITRGWISRKLLIISWRTGWSIYGFIRNIQFSSRTRSSTSLLAQYFLCGYLDFLELPSRAPIACLRVLYRVVGRLSQSPGVLLV